MERRTGLFGWVRNYFMLGVLWSVIINVQAAVVGATPPVMAASGPSTGAMKVLEVAQILAGQIALWPLGIWERVLRPIFG